MLVLHTKYWLLDIASGDKKAFLFQMRDYTFQKVVAMYYKEKLTFLPTVSYVYKILMMSSGRGTNRRKWRCF